MAAYATSLDVRRLYGQALLDMLAPRYTNPDTGITTTDIEAIDHALVAASGEIDSFLAGRYRTPLDKAPQHIMQLAIDIAVYRIALGLDVQSAEHRLRYEDAIKRLTMIANGTITIGTSEWDEELPVKSRATYYAFPMRG